MGSPQPSGCYRSKTDHVLALSKAGVDDKSIAALVGICPTSVSALRASAKRRGLKNGGRSRGWEGNNRQIAIGKDVLEHLRPHAQRRNVTPNELARRLLAQIVDDNMIDAVLDDRNG